MTDFHRHEAAPEEARYPAELGTILNRHEGQRAREEITSWPAYRPTPLLHLEGLAGEADLGAILYKDESERFGLGAFKALGGAYAVYRQLAAEVRRRTSAPAVRSAELMEGAYREITAPVTVTCASAGNHGRAVAWGAELFGCRSVVYLSESVPDARAAAISGHGAEIVRVPGTYDDAVRRCDRDARRHDRIIVSDTSYPGYMEIPKQVMQGYTVMVDEALDQLAKDLPTHVFVQAGVGGLAAAVCAHLWETLGPDRPRFVVVEPDSAACLYASAVSCRPTAVEGELDTVMGCLAAGEVSLLAWKVLESAANAFMTISDDRARSAVAKLAKGRGGDPSVRAGESGAAGLAGCLAARADARISGRLGLDSRSRVLVFGTEGPP